MRGAPEPQASSGRGELVRLLYRLGRHAANGLLTLSTPTARTEVLVVRRGAAVCGDDERARAALRSRLARAVAEPSISARFEGGVAACPPGVLHQVGLAGWVRSHLEAQLDASFAARLEHELAGARVTLRDALAPEPLDETDRRMLAAMARPRRLDQIWPLARAPRFRLLALLHFLRTVGALTIDAIAERSAPVPTLDPRRAAALRLLGIDATADTPAVKRAYRRLARALHPDLQPHVDEHRRRVLEHRFAELTAAYEALL